MTVCPFVLTLTVRTDVYVHSESFLRTSVEIRNVFFGFSWDISVWNPILHEVSRSSCNEGSGFGMTNIRGSDLVLCKMFSLWRFIKVGYLNPFRTLGLDLISRWKMTRRSTTHLPRVHNWVLGTLHRFTGSWGGRTPERWLDSRRTTTKVTPSELQESNSVVPFCETEGPKGGR